MMNTTCPNCGGDNTQSIEVLLAHGTTTGTIQGGGLSVSQGGGLGGQTFSGTTYQQTELAKKFTLPSRPGNWGCAIVIAIFCGIFVIPAMQDQSLGCSLILLALGGISLLIFFNRRSELPKKQAEWDARCAYLRKAWFCHKCGQDWQPEGD